MAENKTMQSVYLEILSISSFQKGNSKTHTMNLFTETSYWSAAFNIMKFTLWENYFMVLVYKLI